MITNAVKGRKYYYRLVHFDNGVTQTTIECSIFIIGCIHLRTRYVITHPFPNFYSSFANPSLTSTVPSKQRFRWNICALILVSFLVLALLRHTKIASCTHNIFANSPINIIWKAGCNIAHPSETDINLKSSYISFDHNILPIWLFVWTSFEILQRESIKCG